MQEAASTDASSCKQQCSCQLKLSARQQSAILTGPIVSSGDVVQARHDWLLEDLKPHQRHAFPCQAWHVHLGARRHPHSQQEEHHVAAGELKTQAQLLISQEASVRETRHFIDCIASCFFAMSMVARQFEPDACEPDQCFMKLSM